MLIDTTYFIGEINLVVNGETTNGILLLIDKYEPEYLENSLGYSFMKLFLSGIDDEPVAQRWTDLIKGADYVDAKGHTKGWKGLANDEKDNSPIANLAYYWSTRDIASYTTSSGEVKTKSENSSSVSPALKQVRAFNEMIDLTAKLHDFLINAKTDGAPTYPEFDVAQTICYRRINIFNL